MIALVLGISLPLAGMLLLALWSARIIPEARIANVERFGQFHRTLQPGLNFIVPFLDRVRPLIDLREQVISFPGQQVVTEDNLVVRIGKVVFFQVTEPRADYYPIIEYVQAIEQLSARMLRIVIWSLNLEQTLTSSDQINAILRNVLDEESGKWGIQVTRVEIKTIDLIEDQRSEGKAVSRTPGDARRDLVGGR